MSKLAYHIAHFKATQLNGIGNHNHAKRDENSHHTNEYIDTSRSSLNVCLITPEGSLYKAAKARIEEACTGRVTAASNWITEAVVYPPESTIERYRETGDDSELCLFFMDVVDFHRAKFGADNVVAADIHLDETTPHLHLDMVPLTADGKLSSKSLFTRTNLSKCHTELAADLQARGWDIERGESTQNKQVRSLSVPEYKKQAEAAKNELLADIEELKVDCQSAAAELNALTSELTTVREDLQEKERKLAEMQQISTYEEYVRESEGAYNALQAIKNALQALFNRSWVFRNRKAEQSFLEAFEKAVVAVGRTLAAMVGYELGNKVPEQQQRSRAIRRSLDEVIQDAGSRVVDTPRLKDRGERSDRD